MIADSIFFPLQICSTSSPLCQGTSISLITLATLDGKSRENPVSDLHCSAIHFHTYLNHLLPFWTLLLRKLLFCRYQRVRPIIVDPGLYLARRTKIFRATEKRSTPEAFKFFTGKSSYYSPPVITGSSFSPSITCGPNLECLSHGLVIQTFDLH